ncbi:hypothetical protein EG327_007587 [Venturia inaequalis]|uniref:Uncharacterized protein n=1 Tax=Venturia inaequalis TaxID=5025 RepID=A0A8H3VS57_VENIN|nr:hypothetical protein EG327_007587 [Venturia inaequalis]
MALMVPLQAPFLEVTAPDDDMEISSDAGRVEPDNDIDLLDGDDDIDYMLEDTRSEQGQSRIDEMPDASRDDIMYDDDLDEITYAEEEMHEDVPVPDEHLTDVSEFLEDPGVAQPPQPVAVDGQTIPSQVNITPFDASTVNDQQVSDNDALADTVDYFEAGQEQMHHDGPPSAIQTEPTESATALPELEEEGETQEQEQHPEQDSTVDAVTSTRKGSSGEASPPTISNDLTGLVEENTTPQLLESTNPTSQNDVAELDLNDDKKCPPALQTPIASPHETKLSLATTSSQEEVIESVRQGEAQIEATGPPQQSSDDKQEDAGPRDAGPPRSFHTTVVDYEGAHISLFPPMEEDEADTFLLGDISLADKTLVDLFRACRQVLGDSINDSLELEIYCEDLDLTISEDSTDCMTTSFSQLVDVYVTLSRQDGIEHPEPFSIIMAKKPRWNSRLSFLYLAAAELKGLSSVQANQYSEEYAEADDDYEENGLEEFDNGPSTGSKNEAANEDGDEVVPAQSRTESRFEDAAEETTGESTEAQETATTTITDTEPAHNETSSSEDHPADEVLKEDNDTAHKTEAEEIDQTAEAETTQLEHVEQDRPEAVPETQLAASAGDDSLNQIGGIENGDNESSGSSTVQEENGHPASSQYSSWDESEDDDSLLMTDEDTVHEGSLDHLQTAPGPEKNDLPDSFSDVNAEDQATALADDGEWPEVDEEAQQDESYPEDSYAQDGYYQDPEAAPQEWDQVGHEGIQTYDDNPEDEQVPNADETSEQVADHEWATFDEDFDFDVAAEEQHPEEAAVPAPEHFTSSGTFRVPDDSAGEDDEDSITYDDDELDLPPHPKPETVQTRSSGQSPLGKRIRDDDDSDQESKRLKSQ